MPYIRSRETAVGVQVTRVLMARAWSENATALSHAVGPSVISHERQPLREPLGQSSLQTMIASSAATLLIANVRDVRNGGEVTTTRFDRAGPENCLVGIPKVEDVNR